MESLHRIRTADLEDAPEIARLTQELGYQATPETVATRLASMLDHAHQTVFIAALDGSLAGWIGAQETQVLTEDRRVEIVGLVVDATIRRSGVGRSLVTAVELWAKGRGVHQVLVRSNAARETSHRFFLEFGFERVKTQHIYRKPIGTDHRS